ncbi:MAG TPA: hypothetical protein VLW50_09415 [Streptosporangiaceae bacterium]|nr:hypothetical protein [Streptosporangiaceae bacterium]
MWARPDQQREAIRQAGLKLSTGELMETATGRGAQVEGVTMVLLLTGRDDFNALGSMVLSSSMEGGVYRLAPATPGRGVIATPTGGQIIFGPQLTGPELARRFGAGSRVQSLAADGGVPAGHDLLFPLRADGQLVSATSTSKPVTRTGDTLILLAPAPAQHGAGPGPDSDVG